MAFHPFRTFQRHQRGCLAGATLLAMISFLFLGAIIQLLGGRSGGSGSQIETIAECRRFGKITNRELSVLSENHETFRRFMIVLYQNLADPSNEEKMNALRSLEVFVNQAAARRTPEALINTWLITQYALEEGLSPDWNSMQQLLTDLTGGYLSDEIYAKTLKDVGISQSTVEYLLAKYMIESQAMERFNLSISAISPATRWDWYQRLHRQITIEAAAVPVEKFVDQINKPNEKQLNEFFEKYKSKKYDVASPESGLVLPTELAFQYVVAAPNQKMLDSLTDDEIKTYYEENKDAMFRKPTKPLTDLPGMPGGSSSTIFPTPGRIRPNVPLPTESEDQPAEQPKEEEPKAEESAPETSFIGATTRLVKYQSEENPAPAEPVKNEEPKVEPPAVPVEEPAKSEEPKVEPPAVPVEEPAKSEEPKVETPAAPAEPAKSEELKAETPVDISILYRPLDEVKDQIRETLAREKAAVGLPVIQEKMKEYAKVYNEHIEQGKEIPPIPDLSGIAAEQGLELKTVPLGDIYATIRTEIARGLYERERIIRLYSEAPLLFESETFSGSNGQVLFWVTELKSEKRPEKLDEVREIAVKRWKEIEARTLAQKEAEEFAAEVKTSGKSLTDGLLSARNDVSVTETEPFTWKTYGAGVHPLVAIMQRQPPMLGEVREKGVAVGDAAVDNKLIFAPGSDFMEKVFSLPIGEIGVVFNQPQSVAYVVRVIGSSPSEDVLWERFQNTYVLEYLYAGQPEMMASAFESWLTDIQTKTGFKWINKPQSYYED